MSVAANPGQQAVELMARLAELVAAAGKPEAPTQPVAPVPITTQVGTVVAHGPDCRCKRGTYVVVERLATTTGTQIQHHRFANKDAALASGLIEEQS